MAPGFPSAIGFTRAMVPLAMSAHGRYRKSWGNIAQAVIGVMIDHGSEDCPIYSTPNR